MRLNLAALMLAGLFFAPPALAQDTDQRARELYENGAMLYEEGRYEDAILAWQEAHRLSQRPALLYNIANAQERLGLWRDALETLNEYRAYAASDQRDLLDRRIANLERRLKDQESATQSSSSSSTKGSGRKGDMEGVPMGYQVETIKPSGPSIDPVPVALFGGGGALLIGGGVFAARASSARQEAALSCTELETGTWCLDSARDAVKQDRVSSVLADTGFLLGGAAIVGGVLVIALDGDGPRLGLGPGHLTVQGRF